MRILVLLLAARNEWIRLQEYCPVHQEYKTLTKSFAHWIIVNDTGGIFTAGSLILVGHHDLRISLRIVKTKLEMALIFRGLREDDSWKNLIQKISWHCPFKPGGGSFKDAKGYWFVFINTHISFVKLSWDLGEIQLLSVVLEAGLKETQPLTL